MLGLLWRLLHALHNQLATENNTQHLTVPPRQHTQTSVDSRVDCEHCDGMSLYGLRGSIQVLPQLETVLQPLSSHLQVALAGPHQLVTHLDVGSCPSSKKNPESKWTPRSLRSHLPLRTFCPAIAAERTPNRGNPGHCGLVDGTCHMRGTLATPT